MLNGRRARPVLFSEKSFASSAGRLGLRGVKALGQSRDGPRPHFPSLESKLGDIITEADGKQVRRLV
jgi:hypothetical protein